MVWIKWDNHGDYFFPKAAFQECEGTLAEIESCTVILKKDPYLWYIKRNSNKGLLISAPDAKSDVHLPNLAEEWECIKCPVKQTCNPSSINKQDWNGHLRWKGIDSNNRI